MMTEIAVEKYLKARVERAGGRCYKWVAPGMAGVPDRICLLPRGQVWFVEVKQKGGRLGKHQKVVLRLLEGLGMNTAVVWCRDDVDGLLEEMVPWS